MTDTNPLTQPPAGLSDRAAAYWDWVVTQYDLAPYEVLTLHDIVNVLTSIDRNQAELNAADSLTHINRHGEIVAHPLGRVLRQDRALLVTLSKALDLPDPETGQTARRNPRGRPTDDYLREAV